MIFWENDFYFYFSNHFIHNDLILIYKKNRSDLIWFKIINLNDFAYLCLYILCALRTPQSRYRQINCKIAIIYYFLVPPLKCVFYVVFFLCEQKQFDFLEWWMNYYDTLIK